MIRILTLLAALLIAWSGAAAAARKKKPQAEPVPAAKNEIPIVLDSQRVLLDIDFLRPGGEPRRTLVWFNMGMAAPVVTKALYRELGIDQGQPLRAIVAGETIQAPPNEVVNGDGGIGVPDFPHLFGPRQVEAMLPASLLQQYVVTLDYGRRQFSLAAPRDKPPPGVAVPVQLNPKTGIISVEAQIGGASYPLAIDAGSGYSWMRGDIAKGWLAQHPDWRRSLGAIGPANANMVDYGFEKNGTVFRIPRLTLGPLTIDSAGALATGPILGSFGDALVGDLFWDNWSKGAPAPVVGWIGGNVLQNYRLAIDYPNRVTYWQKQRDMRPGELNQPGLTLVRRGERYFVGGLVRKAGGEEENGLKGVEVGDEVVAVDDLVARGAGKDALLATLHGAPGERRHLLLERGSARIEVDAEVMKID